MKNILTKFIVEDNQLNVYRASFSQTIKEDTMGGGTIELYMNDFSDFSRNNISIEKESYMIYDGYKITDGWHNLVCCHQGFVFRRSLGSDLSHRSRQR